MKPALDPGARLFGAFGPRLALWLFVFSWMYPAVLDNADLTPTFHDDPWFYAHEEAARIAYTEYGELAEWMPWFCGGIPGIASPQDSSLAPDILLRVAFGTARGRRMAVVLFVVLGMEGFFLLARSRRCTTIASLLAAIVFATSGRFNNAIELGQSTTYVFELLPWAVLAFEKGIRDRRWWPLGGFAIAWMLCCGGTYPVPYTVMALGLLLIGELVSRTRNGKGGERFAAPILSFVGVGAFAVGLSAIRLGPLVEEVFTHPRLWLRVEQVSGTTLWQALTYTKNSGADYLAGDAYIGLTAVVFAALGLFSPRRGGTYAFLLAALYFVIGLGDQGWASPYHLLHHLPLFSQLRDPYRYTLMMGFFAALAAAAGMSWVQMLALTAAERWQASVRLRRFWSTMPLTPTRRAWLVVPGTLIVLAAAWSARTELQETNGIRGGVYIRHEPADYHQPFRQTIGNRWYIHVHPHVRLGSLQCFEETPFPESALLRADLPAEEYPIDPSVARVTRQRWSPGSIDLWVEADEETLVLVNQNWHRAWSAEGGTVESHEGLLAVRVPAGERTVHLRFADPWIHRGAVVSVLTLLVIAAMVGREAVRAGRRFARLPV